MTPGVVPGFGNTVVVVEHNMKVVGDLTDRVTVLQFGKILAEGPYDEVRNDPRVITAYLGEDADDPALQKIETSIETLLDAD